MGARPARRLRPFTSASPRRWVGPEAAGRGQTPSRRLRSWSWACPGRPASTARRAPTGPGTPAGGGGAGQCRPPPPSPPGGGTSTHVGGRHREDAVQVLHQLLEGGPLGGRGVPALPHDHVPAGGTQVRPRPVPAPAPPQQRPGPRTHRSCVQLAGLSMRWPSFSSLKSSSTGMPGYGEPPSVKISHSRTPKDQLWGGPARQPALQPAAPEQTLPRAGGWLCPHGFPAPALEGPGPTPPSPRRAGGTYTSLWWV